MTYLLIGELLGRHLLPGDDGADRDVLLIRNGGQIAPLPMTLETLLSRGALDANLVDSHDDLVAIRDAGLLWTQSDVLRRASEIRLVARGSTSGADLGAGGYRMVGVTGASMVVGPEIFWMWSYANVAASIPVLTAAVNEFVEIPIENQLAALSEELSDAVRNGLIGLDCAIPVEPR